MCVNRRVSLRTLLLLPLLLLSWISAASALEPVFTRFFSDKAAEGYDVVSYFTEGVAVKGKRDFSYKWNGATWQFASEDNLTKFQANPEAFAPQYGGYCAWAVSQNYTASGDPEQWSVVGGKLYLNYSASVKATWLKDVPGHIESGDKNWPGLLAK